MPAIANMRIRGRLPIQSCLLIPLPTCQCHKLGMVARRHCKRARQGVPGPLQASQQPPPTEHCQPAASTQRRQPAGQPAGHASALPTKLLSHLHARCGCDPGRKRLPPPCWQTCSSGRPGSLVMWACRGRARTAVTSPTNIGTGLTHSLVQNGAPTSQAPALVWHTHTRRAGNQSARLE